jgi:hypothetical protein
MKTALLIYWILTTTYATYWLIKNPYNRDKESEYVTLLEIVSKLFLAGLLGPVFVPMALLHTIRFKR